MAQANTQKDDHLPGLNTVRAWAKVIGILVGMVLVNLLVAFVTWGWGILITLPLTAYLAFLLLRDAVPRHRLPTGRRPGGAPA